MISAHTIANASASTSLQAGGFLSREWAAYWKRHGQRATARILRDLDDATLRDIGLSRSEIDSVVYGTPGDRRVNYTGR